MRSSLWLVASALGAVAVTATPSSAASVRFGSATRVLLDATIDDGLLVTRAGDEATQQAEVREQLNYVIGQFESREATPNLGQSLHVELGATSRLADGSTQRQYRATFEVSWAKAHAEDGTPSSVDLVLPQSGDPAGLTAFAAKYDPSCNDGMGGSAEGAFWYDFSPPQCGLDTARSPELAFHATMQLALSPKNATGKSPEYQKIWEDGRLVVAYIAGNTGSRSGDAKGPARDLTAKLRRAYGAPTASSMVHGSTYTVYDQEFNTPAGKLVVHAFDLDDGNVQGVDQAFVRLFRADLKDADLVSYNGHAGLGNNVRAFTKLAAFTPARYYLYWINACKPYAYLDPALFDATKLANPDVATTKFLDVMTTTGVGTFADASDLATIISSLVGKKDDFQALFKKLGPETGDGDPSVIGDEDNMWPAPF